MAQGCAHAASIPSATRGARSFGSTLMLACGEANIVSTQRGSPDITDPMGFMANLADKRLILNPTHTRMKRWEMAKKRRQFSIDGRTVVSVWNPDNKDPRTALPWQAYRNGAAVSDQIKQVPMPSHSIYMGVLELQDH
jgi:hypothetical protein